MGGCIVQLCRGYTAKVCAGSTLYTRVWGVECPMVLGNTLPRGVCRIHCTGVYWLYIAQRCMEDTLSRCVLVIPCPEVYVGYTVQVCTGDILPRCMQGYTVQVCTGDTLPRGVWRIHCPGVY